MRFDRHSVDPASVSEEFRGSSKPRVSDGWNRCEIVKVRNWQKRDGVTVVCAVLEGDYANVDVILDPAKEEGEEKAIGLNKAVGRDAFEEIDDTLVGKVLEIKTKLRGDDGYWINGFRMPEDMRSSAGSSVTQPPAPPAERKPAARTNAQKVQAAKGDDAAPLDDIPF